MRLRKPTDEEKKLLLDYYIENKYTNPPSEEERQEETEWVDRADIAVFDYGVAAKTMVVLWDNEAIYTETYTIGSGMIERAFLDQRWFLIDEVVDKKIGAMIEEFERDILEIIADRPKDINSISLRDNWAKMKLRHKIVELKFNSQQKEKTA